VQEIQAIETKTEHEKLTCGRGASEHDPAII
jgi:hypothetical protein